MEAGIDRLTLVAMGVLAQPAPADIALARMQRIEDRQEQGVARRLGNGAVEAGVGLLIRQGIGGGAGLGRQSVQQLDLGLGGPEGCQTRHHGLDRKAHLDDFQRIGMIEDVLQGQVRRRRNRGLPEQCRENGGTPALSQGPFRRFAVQAIVDEGAATLVARDAALLLQHVEGAAERAASDAELLGQHALGRHPPGVEIALLDQLPQPAEGLVGSLHRQGTCKDGSIPPSAGVDQARSTRATNSMKGRSRQQSPAPIARAIDAAEGKWLRSRQFREGWANQFGDWFVCPKADGATEVQG